MAENEEGWAVGGSGTGTGGADCWPGVVWCAFKCELIAGHKHCIYEQQDLCVHDELAARQRRGP